MQFMMVCASHSPLYYAPGRVSQNVSAVREAIAAERKRVEDFNPTLIILFGGDHYGGHQMASMPAFCVGVEATAIADVGGTPGKLRVPRDIAVQAVNMLRQDNIDVGVSYAMDVDHGFSLPLENLTGQLDKYPVLPIFVSCIQPPFVPFHRARALGEAVGRFAKTLKEERILIIGTGGLSHDPEFLFPSIDDVSDEWRPYILNGKRQTDVPQQSWIDYEKAEHHKASFMLTDDSVPIETYGIKENWDKAFLDKFCAGEMNVFDGWTAAGVLQETGIGTMEILSWIAAAAAMKAATGQAPHEIFYNPCREIGVGFGVAETPPAEALAA
jgi:2,3-dihydroxyphenylpropionate 1,2-dioxygenase